MSEDPVETLAKRLWKQWAGAAACGCEFDPRHRDGEHESVHYHRQCYHCGEVWTGLHCPHDGYQNPCPKCGNRPDTINAKAIARECLRQMRWAQRQARESALNEAGDVGQDYRDANFGDHEREHVAISNALHAIDQWKIYSRDEPPPLTLAPEDWTP